EPQMRKAKHTKMAFDVFEYGIYKRRVLEGDDESSADWVIGHPMIFPNSNCDPGTFQVRVPIDDTNTMHYLIRTKPVGSGEEPSLEVKDFPWATPEGKIRIDGVFPTDYMAWITQGPVAPRPLEHLGRTDRGIILYRQLLNDSIAKVQRGEDPHGIIRDEVMNQQMIHIRTENDMGGARRAYQTPPTRLRGGLVCECPSRHVKVRQRGCDEPRLAPQPVSAAPVRWPAGDGTPSGYSNRTPHHRAGRT